MLLCSLFAPAAHADVPVLPHNFYGTVTLDSQSAAVGTVVSAQVRGVYAGNTTVVESGQYGLPAVERPLSVQGAHVQSGDRIIFYVNGFRATQTYTFQAGGSTELNLTARIGVTDITDVIDEDGVVQEPITVQSPNTTARVTIPAGTTATLNGVPLTEITASQSSAPTPGGFSLLGGLAYDFGPSGAIFDPCILLAITYGSLPAGTVEEDLHISRYVGGTWEELPSVVDTVAKTVTACIDHFTMFAVLVTAAAAPTGGGGGGGEAEFELSNLSISPKEVEPGKPVSISVKVANIGDLTGSKEIKLKINGTTAATKEVTLGVGASTTVSFTVTKDEPGTYKVEVDGLSGSFKVLKMVAEFVVSDLAISPKEVKPGQPVSILAKVTNTGGVEGSYTITLKINGATEATKEVTLAAGASTTITFSVTKDQPGTYTVGVDGLSGSFKVSVTAPTFTVSDLAISPKEVSAGQPVTISAKVTNTGNTAGSYTAILKINGNVEATKEVALSAGASTTVTFSVTRDEPATYNVELGGQVGKFTVTTAVVVPPRGFPWWWIVIGVVVLAAVYFFIIRRFVTIKRREA